MGNDGLVYIRTDGNETIAAGHLVRCLSIAQSCLDKQMQVCILLADEESRHLLTGFLTEDQKDNPALFLHVLQTAAYDKMEQELSEVISILIDAPDAKKNPPLYLVDSYFVTKQYFSVLNTFARVIYLDDLMRFPYSVDLVINYDVIPHDHMWKYRWAYRKTKKALLGPSYTPLRRQFMNHTVSLKKQVTDILVTTGGSDPYHFCTELLKFWTNTSTQYGAALSGSDQISAPMSASPLTVHVVIGTLNQDKEALYALSQELPRVVLHENVTDMAALMKQCDLAVSAAGTTLYELCALGIPAISFLMADNQLTSARAFAKANAIPCAGDIRREKEAVLSNIFAFFSRMSDFAERKKAHQTMRNLVDGNGSDRIADEILLLKK